MIHKKLLSLTIAFILCFSTIGQLSVNAAENTTEFGGGNGSTSNPYKIATPEHLNNVRNYLSANFIQIADIDMLASTSEGGTYYNEGSGWTPIGTFTGCYDGGEKTINGLNISGSNGGYIGLFSSTKNATIKNVNLTGGTYTPTNSSVCGGIIGSASLTTVTNCSNSNILDTRYKLSEVGGIVGQANESTITNCVNYAKITTFGSSLTWLGGIVGNSSTLNLGASVIDNCYNYGNIYSRSGSTAYAGGIVGSGQVNITNSSNFAQVWSDGDSSSYVGGISSNNAIISSCFNTGKIIASATSTSSSYCGGIIGQGASVFNCYNSGDLQGPISYTGSIAGYRTGTDSSVFNYNYWCKDSQINNAPARKGIGSGFDNTKSKTAADMKSNAFIDVLNENISETSQKWYFDGLDLNGGYPIFSIQSPFTANSISGTYHEIQNISFSVPSGYTAFYTVDGTIPTVESAQYQNAIPIKKNNYIEDNSCI